MRYYAQPKDWRRDPQVASSLQLISVSQVVLWKLRGKVHAVMQHPTDFDLAPSTGTEDQEMTRLMDTPNSFVSAAATVPQVIRPTTSDQTFARSATRPFGLTA